VESLYNKLRSQLEDDEDETLSGAADCDDCTRLTLCAKRLELLIDQLADEPFFRDVVTKMQCTLFQVAYSVTRYDTICLRLLVTSPPGIEVCEIL